MKIANLLIESVTLYRGTTSKNLPKRYPGKFYTEIESLAKWYAKDGGSIETIQFSPHKIFKISDLSNTQFKISIYERFTKFMEDNYPNVDLEDTQLYDNLVNNQTDFSFPTTMDNQFLKSLGYDCVKFDIEGMQKVDSWYIMD